MAKAKKAVKKETVVRKWSSLGVVARDLHSILVSQSGEETMTPGRYLPDPTEGITRVEDLPPPRLRYRSRNYRRRHCPECGRAAYRHDVGCRKLHDLSNL